MSSPPKSQDFRTSKTGAKRAERRGSERFPFSAVSKIVDAVSHSRITARASDLSLYGCYFDVLNVFAAGTKVIISHGSSQFKALGTVAYSLPGNGMGVTFNQIEPDMTLVLQRWIAQARGEIAPFAGEPEVNDFIQNHPHLERHILGRLIGLMMQKNMLTAYEGADLLKELLENKE